MSRTLPDGTTIEYTSEGRIWIRPEGVLRSVGYGPWEPYDAPLIDFGDQTCTACGMEHPGAPCPQPDLFGGQS